MPAPKHSEPPKPDPTKEASYIQSVEKLQAMYRTAEGHLKRRNRDKAAALITEAQPIVSEVIGVPRPTQQAMEIASDFDDLYGRMLFMNRHYGPARMMFQKNVARWRNWRPETEETIKRRKAAEAAVEECDRQIAK